jgi:hypothetical protein
VSWSLITHQDVEILIDCLTPQLLVMGLFRSRRIEAVSSAHHDGPSSVTSPWTRRFNPAFLFRKPTPPPKSNPLPPASAYSLELFLPRAETPSTISREHSHLSRLDTSFNDDLSRTASMFSNITTSPVSATSPMNPLSRNPSVYSHRSHSIRRNNSGLPPQLPSPLPVTRVPTLDSFTLGEHYAEDHGLVLTSTSKYPTGIDAELYIPEDLSYKTAMQRQKDFNRSELRNTLIRNGTIIRRRSGIQSPEERNRLKRLSINF